MAKNSSENEWEEQGDTRKNINSLSTSIWCGPISCVRSPLPQHSGWKPRSTASLRNQPEPAWGSEQLQSRKEEQSGACGCVNEQNKVGGACRSGINKSSGDPDKLRVQPTFGGQVGIPH